MATGTAKITNPSSGSTGVVSLGEVLSPQAWADLMASANSAVGGLLGSKSFKYVAIDGVGNQAVTPDSLLVLSTTCANIADRNKVIKLDEGTAGAVKGRWFLTQSGGVMFTMNADYSNGGAVWATDNNAAGAQRWSIGANSFGIDTHAAGVSWVEGGWSTSRLLFDPITGNLTVVGTSAGLKLQANSSIGSATGGAGQAVAAGEVWADMPLRAWCRAKATAAPDITLEWSTNIASVSRVAAGKYRFTLQSGAAAATKIAPVATVCAASPFAWTIPPSTITATVFEVWTYDLGGVLTELAPDDRITAHIAAT